MRIRKGWVVKIEFDDHSEDGEASMPFIVYGRIHKSTKKDITLDCWTHPKDTPGLDRSQVKCYTIVKRAITKFTRLSEMPDVEENPSTVGPSLRTQSGPDTTGVADKEGQQVVPPSE